jgi:hypothetical protein
VRLQPDIGQQFSEPVGRGGGYEILSAELLGGIGQATDTRRGRRSGTVKSSINPSSACLQLSASCRDNIWAYEARRADWRLAIASEGSMPQQVGASESNPPTLDQVVDGICTAERALLSDPASFRMALVNSRTVLSGPAEFHRVHTRVILAHKRDKWYSEIQEVEQTYHPEWKSDPEVRYYVAKGSVILDWTRSRAIVTPFENGWNIFSEWAYVRHLGFNVNRRIAQSGGADYDRIQLHRPDNPDVTQPLLPDFLAKNLQHYWVLRQPDFIDGHRCWVVEWPGMDRIWVDSDCGFAIRRRIYHWAPDKQLRCEIDQKDIREVRPGVWIAVEQVVRNYANRAGQWSLLRRLRRWLKQIAEDYNSPGMPERRFEASDSDTTWRIEQIEFDTVPDDLFDCRLPVRTYVYDRVHDSKFSVVAGGGPFEAY